MNDSATPALPKRRASLTVLRRMLRVIVIAYIVIIILMTVFESRLVFPGAYRSDFEHDTSGQTAWSAEYQVGEEDPRALTGHWIERPSAERTVIFFHGNGTTATRQIPWGYQLSEAWNANVLVAEYRGFTDQDLTPNESNIIEDALASFDGLCDFQKLRPDEVIVFGRSLGGGCAAAVAAQREIRGLVLDRTFDSAVSVAAGRFPWVPVHWLMRNRFDSTSKLETYEGPIVQIHGRNDTIVPFENGKRLHDSLTTPEKLWIERERFGHLDPMPDAILKETIQWLDEHASGTQPLP